MKQRAEEEGNQKTGVVEALNVDDNMPSDYEEWINNWARVYQMVDNDKAPVVIKERNKFRVVFPAVPFGVNGKIIFQDGHYLLDVEGQLYSCVSITINKARATELRKQVKARMLENEGQVAVVRHAARYTK